MLIAHLDKLYPFTIIAQTKSLRRASEILGIAQPALTRTVKILEAELGATLFRRSVQGMELTQEGATFLAFAETTLRRADDVKQRIGFALEETAGVLSIATYESLSIYLWPRLLSTLKNSLPNLRFRLKTNIHGDALEHLATGKFDLVVDAEPRPRDNMVSVTLYTDVFQFYAAPTLSEPLAECSFIYVQSAYDQEDRTISEHLQAAGLRNPTLYEIDSFETAKALAHQGLGIAVLPVHVAQESVKSKRLKKISFKNFPMNGFGKHRICATYLATNRNDPRIKATIREMKKFFAATD